MNPGLILDPNTKLRFGINDIDNQMRLRISREQEELHEWMDHYLLPYSCTTGLYLLDEHGHNIEVHKHCCPNTIAGSINDEAVGWHKFIHICDNEPTKDFIPNCGDGFMKLCYELHTDPDYPFPLHLVTIIGPGGSVYKDECMDR